MQSKVLEGRQHITIYTYRNTKIMALTEKNYLQYKMETALGCSTAPKQICELKNNSN